MKNLGIVIAILIVILGALFVFFSCTGDGDTPPISEATLPLAEQATDASPATTATPAVAKVDAPALTDAPPATPTNESAAVAPVEAAPVTAKTLVNLNLRQGPDTIYGKAGTVPAGAEVVVIGRNADNTWLVVKSDAGQVWMIGGPDFVTVDAAAIAALPVIAATAPYNASNPRVKQVLEEIPLVVLHGGNHTCASKGGLNHLLDNVVSGNVIGPHSGDFVYGPDNVLFEYSDGILRMIKENPIARFESDEKSLSFERAMQLFEANEITWTGHIGEWPARGVLGCDLSAKP